MSILKYENKEITLAEASFYILVILYMKKIKKYSSVSRVLFSIRHEPD
jgi:hypothetical protein